MTKATVLRALTALATATVLTACDRVTGPSAGPGARTAAYEAAMADYSAGRLEAAQRGFSKVLQTNPDNAPARFQLACLLQDRQGDYLGAICQYREYLQQAPDSEKAPVARRRLEACERLYESALAQRLNLSDNTAVMAENARLKKDLEGASAEIAQLKATLAKTEKERAVALQESQRLRRFVSSIDEGESATRPKIDITDAELVDDVAQDEGVSRKTYASEVDQLVSEEGDEQTATPFKSVAAKTAPAPKKPAEKEPKHEKRPATYVVKEGDTLYKLAIRFYGRRSAWSLIRNANKATISTDGRVKTGQEIVLPDPAE